MSRDRNPALIVAAAQRHVDARTGFRHSGTARTRPYGMDAAFMLFQRRGWGIHVVSTEPERAVERNRQSRGSYGNAGAPRVSSLAPFRRPMTKRSLQRNCAGTT